MGFILGKHQFTIHGHIKDAFAISVQYDLNVHAREVSRQTVRLGFVVSLGTVTNVDSFHDGSPIADSD